MQRLARGLCRRRPCADARTIAANGCGTRTPGPFAGSSGARALRDTPNTPRVCRATVASLRSHPGVPGRVPGSRLELADHLVQTDWRPARVAAVLLAVVTDEMRPGAVSLPRAGATQDSAPGHSGAGSDAGVWAKDSVDDAVVKPLIGTVDPERRARAVGLHDQRRTHRGKRHCAGSTPGRRDALTPAGGRPPRRCGRRG